MKTTLMMTATTKNDESSRKTGAILADTDSIITDGNTRSTVQKNGASAAPTGRDDGKASILSNGGTVSDGASAAPTAVTSGKKRKMDDGAAADDDDDNNGDRPVKKKRWCTEVVFHRGVSKSTVMAGGAALLGMLTWSFPLPPLLFGFYVINQVQRQQDYEWQEKVDKLMKKVDKRMKKMDKWTEKADKKLDKKTALLKKLIELQGGGAGVADE